jgi:hypothetical protein
MIAELPELATWRLGPIDPLQRRFFNQRKQVLILG